MPADGDAGDPERLRHLVPVHPLHLDEDEHGALAVGQERERGLEAAGEIELLRGPGGLLDVEVVAGAVPRRLVPAAAVGLLAPIVREPVSVVTKAILPFSAGFSNPS